MTKRSEETTAGVEAPLSIAAYRYSGPHGAECVIDTQGDNWYGYAAVTLPEGEEYALSNGTAPASPFHCDAVIDACEGLIAWLSEQKGETRSKKHRKQAEEVQGWAIDLVAKMRAEKQAANKGPAPETPEASVEPVAVERRSIPSSEAVALSVPALQTSAMPQMFPLERLRESPLNPRQYIPEAGIEQMAASIREGGFRPWLPIVARPCGDGYAEIAAGHRRRLGAIRAGLTEVPCIIREMSDDEFLDILNFDNSGREDVHELHESAGWRTWMEKTGKGVRDIAARIGQSVGYVYQRLKYSDLIPEAKQSFLDGTITAGHAILIARLDSEDQERALRATEPPAWNPEEKVSVRELANWIKKNCNINLQQAPFSLVSVDLVPSAGSCESCQYRSGNAPDFDAAADLPDVCMRPFCYEQKLEAHIQAETERIKSAEGVLLSEGSFTRREGVLPSSMWHQVKQDAPGAKPGLIVEGIRRGTAVFVLLQETMAFQQQPAPAPPKPKKQAAPKKSAEEIERERREREEFIAQQQRDEARRQAEEAKRKRQIELELSIRRHIVTGIFSKVQWPPKREDILRLLDTLDLPDTLDPLLEAIGINPRDWTRANRANMEKLSPANLAKLVVLIAVCDDFDEWTLSRGCDSLMAAAKRWGVNAAKIRGDAERKAKEAEGGTRKEVVGKLPSLNQPKAKAKPAENKATAKQQPAKKGGKK